MKARQEANRYDKIFKENLEAVTLALVEKVLGIAVASYQKLPLELQRTLERKPDQLLKITDQQGHTFLLHLEFQLADEADMVERMLEYRGIFRRKFGLPVRQYVLFLSNTVPTMPTRLEEAGLVFSFELVRLSQVDYRLFLSSEKADEVVFALLGDLGSSSPQQAASRIIERLEQTSADSTQLRRHLQQLRILANLRGLSPLIEQIMQSITPYIREEDDYFFKKGIAQGIEQGLEKGIEQAILRLLKAGVLSTGQLASLFEVSEAFVEQLRRRLAEQ
jgi:hypothetical protein